MQSDDCSLYPQATITKVLPIASTIEPSMMFVRSPISSLHAPFEYVF